MSVEKLVRPIGSTTAVRMRQRRGFWVTAVCGLIVTAFAAEACAQQDKKVELVVEPKTFSTVDGWQLAGTYYKSPAGKESPVVVLLHDKGENRLVWKNEFPESLQSQGYAVITVDLRKHGQSKMLGGGAAGNGKKGADSANLNNKDYRLMVEDLEAVKRFIFEENQKEHLNMRKTAIVAPGMSAPVAINFATRDWFKEPYKDAPTRFACTPRGQDIRALVFLSGDQNLPGLPSGRALSQLKNPAWGVAALFCVGSKDIAGKRDAQKMHKQLASFRDNKERMYLKDKYNTSGKGTELIGKKLKVEGNIRVFLKRHLKDLSDSSDMWRNRKSRAK